MRTLNLLLLLLSPLLDAALAGDYCDDFEPNGDFGSFWFQISEDSNGKWEPTSYEEISKNITDFPAPASGDTVLYLAAPKTGNTASARMETHDTFRFPNGSNISFRYWLRSTTAGSATLYVKLALNRQEKQTIIDLSSYSNPDNNDWMEVSEAIVCDENTDYQIMIFAYHTVAGPLDNIAIDDIMISGPDDLPDRNCEPSTTTTVTTTTEPSTTTTVTTTTEPTTTTVEPTTSTEPPTTTEPTTGPSTSSEPAPSPDLTTSELPPSSEPTPPADGRRYGSSALLWLVFVVLGTSLVLVLVLALGRRQRRQDDQLALVQHHSPNGSTSGGSGGWYHYVTNDPWTRLHGRMKHLWY